MFFSKKGGIQETPIPGVSFKKNVLVVAAVVCTCKQASGNLKSFLMWLQPVLSWDLGIAVVPFVWLKPSPPLLIRVIFHPRFVVSLQWEMLQVPVALLQQMKL